MTPVPPIALSTGTVPGVLATETARALIEAGGTAIELSAGSWAPGIPEAVERLSAEVPVPLNLHNYFPPPSDPFTLNLASADAEIARRSVRHVRGAVRLSARIGAPDFGFHAGFLIDPSPSELGRPLALGSMSERSAARDRFVERVHGLAAEARDLGVALLVENNVLSGANLERFGADPLLMTDPEDAVAIMRALPAGVGMLMDVAHCKVSAKTLGFDPSAMIEACSPWIRAYHLSDNDGTEDSNGPVEADSWFWRHLHADVNRVTLEVRDLEPVAYVAQADLVADHFSRMLSGPDRIAAGDDAHA